MAISIIENLRNPAGILQELYLDVDGSSSYPTGGQEIKASDLGLKQILAAQAGTSDNAGHIVAVRPGSKGHQTTIKLVWVVVGTGAEVANTTNLSARYVKVRILGR